MFDLNEKGCVKQRESQALEFKESFRLGDLPRIFRSNVT